MLVMLALLIAVCGIVSFVMPLGAAIRISDSHAVVVHFYDGLFRALWIDSTEPIIVSLEPAYPSIRIHSANLEWPPPIEAWIGIDPERNEWIRWIRLGERRNVPDFGGTWKTKALYGGRPPGTLWHNRDSLRYYNPTPAIMAPPMRTSFVRTPVWLPCTLLLLLPCRMILRRRYRIRNNQCQLCGYRLYGLTEPRCPECGTATKNSMKAGEFPHG